MAKQFTSFMNLTQAKQLLGPSYDCLSDEQVQDLVQVMEVLVEYLACSVYPHEKTIDISTPNNIE